MKDREDLKLKAELDAIRAERGAEQTQQLANQGEFKSLWEQANATNTDLSRENERLKQEMEAMKAGYQQESIKSRFIAKTAAQLNAPEQFFELHRSNIRDKDGNLVFLQGGVETDLDSALNSFRQPDSGYEFHFRPTGTTGMGISGGPVSVGSSQTPADNPYRTGNVAAIVQLELSNPKLAETLRAEAKQSAS